VETGAIVVAVNNNEMAVVAARNSDKVDYFQKLVDKHKDKLGQPAPIIKMGTETIITNDGRSSATDTKHTLAPAAAPYAKSRTEQQIQQIRAHAAHAKVHLKT
jgi:hypothetical protein